MEREEEGEEVMGSEENQKKKKNIHVERERKEREGGVGNANYTSYFASCVEMMKIWHHGG